VYIWYMSVLDMYGMFYATGCEETNSKPEL